MKYSQQQLNEAPKINVGGKDWPIPIFGPRQNRRIVPMISALAGKTANELTIEDMDRLYNIIYWAIARAHDDITEKDFQDWDIPIDEAMRAIPIIGKQTGLMSMAKTRVASVAEVIEILQKEPDQKAFVQFNVLIKKKEETLGEAGATETLTGTSSSPASSPAQDEDGMK